MSRDALSTAKTPQELRIELKTWELDFAKANGGRKPTREDIRENATISAKYREYDNLRRRKSRPQTTPRKNSNPALDKTNDRALKERSANAVAATPSKSAKDVKSLPPAGLPSPGEDEQTPAHVRCALGPTPQKDGAVLGIFDILSAGTPSKGGAGVPQTMQEALAAATPSKPKVTAAFGQEPSRTPQSSSRRFYLDAYAGTPLKRKRDGVDQTPSTAKKLFATPSFLRRNWPLAQLEEDTTGPTAAAIPPFNKRGLVRSLSTIIQGLKKQEEDRMEDEWDIMNEIEAEERGETSKPAVPSKVLVEDSQAAEMPLGPDQGADSSESEGADDPGALDANGNPRKVWKKKGLKRQTRRVIMRPVAHKPKERLAENAAVGAESEGQTVEGTQSPAQRARQRRSDGDEDEFGNEADSDAGPKHDSQPSRPERCNKSKTKKQGPEQQKVSEKKPKKVKPEAHANYRKLKIKNKNSKANGRGGRFGRR